ncbi:MAG: FHA domain-containing protein [Actinobacteria bacterium]|nr:FHA domain-containing protein [Actinomycetota bacterium]
MSYVYCNRCAHRNPPQAAFCSVCGAVLDSATDRTITLTRVDALQDSAGHSDDVVFRTSELPIGGAVLVSRTGEQYGDRFPLGLGTTNIGRHPNSDIVLDDITVSRRHAQVVLSEGAYVLDRTRADAVGLPQVHRCRDRATALHPARARNELSTVACHPRPSR